MPCGMWDLPGPGTEPVSPALAGRFLTTGPPGKSSVFFSIFIYMAVLVAVHRSFSCGMWDSVPGPGVEPGSLALGVWSRSPWTSKEVPKYIYIDTSGLILHDSQLFSVLFNALSYFVTL